MSCGCCHQSRTAPSLTSRSDCLLGCGPVGGELLATAGRPRLLASVQRGELGFGPLQAAGEVGPLDAEDGLILDVAQQIRDQDSPAMLEELHRAGGVAVLEGAGGGISRHPSSEMRLPAIVS